VAAAAAVTGLARLVEVVVTSTVSISDDMTRVYFRDRDTRCWHTLTWGRAASPDMPLSEGAAAPPRRAPTTTNTVGAMVGGVGSNGTRAFSAQLAHLH
jgi:hypothetical protein